MENNVTDISPTLKKAVCHVPFGEIDQACGWEKKSNGFSSNIFFCTVGTQEGKLKFPNWVTKQADALKSQWYQH